MRFDLSYPPTANTMFPSAKNGKRVLSAKGKKYRDSVYADVLEQHGLFKPLQRPVRVMVEFWMPDNRKRDLDNLFKALFDSLQYANVFIDDQQIVEIHAYKRDVIKGGKCHIIMEEL